MSYIKKHKEGFILTIAFHAIILLIMFSMGFFTPLPFPEEQGVLVDFGTSDAGLGKVESARQSTPVTTQQQEVQEQVSPPPTPPPASAQSTPSQGNQEVMTQNYEQTVAVDEGKKKRDEEALKKREEAERLKREQDEKQRLENQERARQQQAEQQKVIESERRKQDSIRKIELAREAEIQRIAELRKQEEARKAEEQARIDAINSRAQNVFSGSSGQNTSNSSSGQGTTYPQGNQGTSSGTAGAERYGLGGGEGISFDLSGRSAENLRKPEYPGQEEGTVVVQITVDKNGLVTKATPGVRGSTSLAPGLLKAAQNAAMITRFNADPNAPAFQTGTITYRFVLN